MKKLFVVVEGVCEERFVRNTLAPYLPGHKTTAILVETSRHASQVRRGGGKWKHWLADIQGTLGPGHGRIVTTMFDLYGLPADFPGKDDTVACTSAYADALEAEMAKGVGDNRFLPNLIRHEFETLVLASMDELEDLLTKQARTSLARLRVSLGNHGPEDINCGKLTAPSKRLQSASLGFNKLLHGEPAVRAAGVRKIRNSCPRFDAWITRLEAF